MQNHVHVIAHHGKGVNASRENVTQFQNARFQPGFSMFKRFAAVMITSTQPRSAHAAVNQMEKLRLSWVRAVVLAALPPDRSNAERLCRRPESTSWRRGWVMG